MILAGTGQRLIRAAGFIMDWCGVDKVFERDMVNATDRHVRLVRTRMARALDRPIDELRAPVRSAQEGVGRAILPVIAEVLRSSVPPTGKIVRQITGQVPPGYAGPVGLQGVGLHTPVVNLDVSGVSRVSDEARVAFGEMQTFWRRYYHYPLLKKSAETNRAAVDDMRTGIGCPFPISIEGMPDVVSTLTDLLLFVASKIDDRPSPAYEDGSYRSVGIRRLLVGVR
jgi:hypothetical protein